MSSTAPHAPGPRSNAPAEGDVLAGKYRVERVLGVGGMGVVVAAMHLHLGQRVALKFLLDNATPEVVTRFLREARAAVRLKSEHVARVLDVGELPGGAPFMVMEYLDGQDLARVSSTRGPLPVTEAVEHVLHACEAIAEAHAMGIIHRDLKPANLFLTKAADGSSTVKVLDFGISKTLDDAPEGEGMSLTKTTAILGSPLYMSPEQLRSARDVTAHSDIWSLGAILYQLLAGQVPFNTATFSELILMVNMNQPPPMASFRDDVPPALEAAVLRCLEKSVTARYSNVGELAWAICDYGRPDGRSSAERITRTLEAAGIEVPRSIRLSVHEGGPASLPPGLAASTPSTLAAARPGSGPPSGSLVALASSASRAGPPRRGRGMLVI